MAMTIPFNKPFLTGKEAHYIYQAVYSGKLSGNGVIDLYAYEQYLGGNLRDYIPGDEEIRRSLESLE